MDPSIKVLGQDIYAMGYLEEIVNVREFKTFQRDKLIQNSISINVKNYDDFFSVNNPRSIFAGISWRYTALTIHDEDGELIWNGVITDIIRNHETKEATIISENSLVKFMNRRIAYTSSDWETAAEAARNILDQEGLTDYSAKSFQDSIDRLEANDCYVMVDIQQEDDVSLQQAIEKLAEFACADCYSHRGLIYFKHYKPFSGGVKVNLSISREDDEIEAPNVESAIDIIVNDYSIRYDGDGGTAATDSNSNNIGAYSRNKFGTHSMPDMGSGTDDQIVFKDKTSATYIGECYIRRSHLHLSTTSVDVRSKIEFSVSMKNRDWIDLETYFTLTLPDEGWTEEIFEIYDFERNQSSREIKITAYQVERT